MLLLSFGQSYSNSPGVTQAQEPMLAQESATELVTDQAPSPSMESEPIQEVESSAEESGSAAERLLTQGRIVIDEIIVRVNGVNLLRSELLMPRIVNEGRPFSLDEAILEELLFQRAGQMHMLPSTADIERHLVTFKIQNHLTELSDKEFENELKQHGFSLPMYKNQLGRMIAVENVKRAEISEKIVVTSQEVEDYYNKNPRYTKEQYHLKLRTIPVAKMAEKDVLLLPTDPYWEDLGWIEKKDVEKKFAAVFTMEKGQISEPIADGESNQFIMLVDKKERCLKTLNERYIEIERKLQQEKKETFVGTFEQELKEKATIVVLAPA